MSHSPADLDFANTRDVAAREIALSFGVLPMLLGIPGDNTYSNYAQANLALWRQTVLPLVARTCAQLTRWLAPKFGEALRIGYDIDAIPALAEAREATWEKLTAASFLSLNEKHAVAFGTTAQAILPKRGLPQMEIGRCVCGSNTSSQGWM